MRFTSFIKHLYLLSGFTRRPITALCLAALFLLPDSSAARTRTRHHPVTLSGEINALLRQPGARRGFWGIEVVRLSDGRRLYAHNSSRLFEPASNMKLFTAAAALMKLGPDFVFRTTVESSAAPDAEGRVPDLILVGRGDPNLGSRVVPYVYESKPRIPADLDFQKLADEVVQKGVREVTGDLVADDSYFVDEPYGAEWSVDDMIWSYGAPVSALAFNDNSLMLQVTPAETAGAEASVVLDPVDDDYKIISGVRTVARGDHGKVTVERAPGSMELEVGGTVSAGSDGEQAHVAIQNPPQFIGEMFRRELEARGVKIDGVVRVRELTPFEAAEQADPPAPEPARVTIAEHDSLPLREDIKVTLKVSQNLHAEMLLRTLAHQEGGAGSLEGGLDLLRNFADQIGIPSDAIYFSGGSGLSRTTLVAPQAIIRLLEYMAHSPEFHDFYDALPIAGVDGTLGDRFQHTAAQGRIHAKTGTLEHVSALSGYMDLPHGPRLAFSILANDYPMHAWQAEKIMDHIALDIYRHYARVLRKP